MYVKLTNLFMDKLTDLVMGAIVFLVLKYVFSGLYNKIPLPNKLKFLLSLYMVIKIMESVDGHAVAYP